MEAEGQTAELVFLWFLIEE